MSMSLQNPLSFSNTIREAHLGNALSMLGNAFARIVLPSGSQKQVQPMALGSREMQVQNAANQAMEVQPANHVNIEQPFIIQKNGLEYTNADWMNLTGIFEGMTRDEAWELTLSTEPEPIQFIIENMDLFNEEEEQFQEGSGKYLGLRNREKFDKFNEFAKSQVRKFSNRKTNQDAAKDVLTEVADFQKVFKAKGGFAKADDYRWAHDTIRDALEGLYAF